MVSKFSHAFQVHANRLAENLDGPQDPLPDQVSQAQQQGVHVRLLQDHTQKSQRPCLRQCCYKIQNRQKLRCQVRLPINIQNFVSIFL